MSFLEWSDKIKIKEIKYSMLWNEFNSPGELECENPLEANILLTLAGVKSIMSNQWNSTLAENSEKLQTIFKGNWIWIVVFLFN